MAFNNLEQGLKKLSDKFEKDLINELDRKGHNKTGKLEKSINFEIIETGGNYSIQLTALDYIKYLDDGNFLKDFLQDKEKELAKALPALIIKDLKEELNIK